MDLSQFSTEQLAKLKQKKQLVNSFISGVGQKAKSIMPDRPEPITQESRDKWLATLNPADYQTQLSQEEAQRFSDWAAQNNVPISQDYDMQGLWKNEIAPYDALKGKFTDEQIAGAKQGLNGGNVELAKFIDQMGTRKPVTPSEMALAKQGKFNDIPYDAATGHYTDKYKTPWHESFSRGSQYATGDAEKYAGTWDGNNYISPITQATKDGILQQVLSGMGGDTATGWNKVGKGLDVARAIASNPALQGLIAGTVKGKLSGDWGKGLEYGIDWAGNKAKSNYYAQLLGQKPGIIGNYTKDDYNAQTLDKYRQAQIDNNKRKVETQLAIALAKDETSRLKLLEDAQKENLFDDAELIMMYNKYNLPITKVNKSNKTIDTQSKVDKRTADIERDKKKLTLEEKKINNNYAVGMAKANAKGGKEVKVTSGQLAATRELLKSQPPETQKYYTNALNVAESTNNQKELNRLINEIATKIQGGQKPGKNTEGMTI